MSITANTSWMPASVREDLKDPANAAEYEKGQELLRGLLQRSATDVEFRSLVVTDTPEAIRQQYKHMYGTEAPEGIAQLNISFIEPQGDLTVVLPPAIDAEAELNDSELQTVAGGATPAVVAATAVSTPACLGFAAGVATVVLVAWAISD
jgi:lactobin A/cerein 7B family class IIb bacteriocin